MHWIEARLEVKKSRQEEEDEEEWEWDKGKGQRQSTRESGSSGSSHQIDTTFCGEQISAQDSECLGWLTVGLEVAIAAAPSSPVFHLNPQFSSEPPPNS